MKYAFILFISFSIFGQKQMPDISLKNLDNLSLNVKNDFVEQDKLYIFSFWATWCAPCIQELQAINEYYNDWQNELNVEVIAVSVDDSRTQKRVTPMVNGKGWTYTVLLDKNQDLKRALSITNVPFLIVVKNKEIVKIHNGYSDGAVEELYEELKEL
ncbi:TlpA disulfide reductase family protein [uncultured Flavobacterium sp.]|uniref:TlpA family protein disulfide reductase n=1 Tax=uncultured Flavobacterium sp. TaxID=165435 RepID=UPI0030CA3FB3|tara:strand:+ start:2087 stop:2557 length:471 start_codon:yes stop_codon:yes gene_type:complete